jgi:hypothetical protein
MFCISLQATVGSLLIADAENEHILVSSENKQDRQCTCNVTVRHVRVTIVTVEKQ